MDDEQAQHGEIIIVRRGHDDHDDHHGGAWKVAFADFMTAMMAFFLVMWLINASNEETKKAVASYFNPIKLTDRVSNPKGVRTPKYGEITNDNTEEVIENTVISHGQVNRVKGEGVAQTFDEQALFTDPYALLAEISSGLDQSIDEIETQSNQSRTTEIGLTGGEAFEDPFDPSSWIMKYGSDKKNKETDRQENSNEVVQEALKQKKEQTAKVDAGAKKQLEGNKHKENAKLESHKQAEARDLENSVRKSGEVENAAIDEVKTKTADMVREEIFQAVKLEGADAPEVKVVSDKNGTRITLNDKSKTGMFSIGSAKPNASLVRIMKKIGKILSREKGKIIVGGHTDGRKFQSKNYDNWRLSTARAHMAYYMLIRGGVPESRFEMIQGFGDVKLAVPENPLSPVNRRIEISLRIP